MSEAWSAYTDHNPIEVHLVKGWVFRVPPPSHSKMRRPNWRALRGSGESATVAREALAAELDRRVGLEPPVSWSEVVDLGLGVAKAVLGEEPKSDPRPWVRGCEPALREFDKAVSLASSRKRAATSWDEWREANYEVRRCKRRRVHGCGIRRSNGGMIRHVWRRIKPTKAMLLGCLPLFVSLSS